MPKFLPPVSHANKKRMELHFARGSHILDLLWPLLRDDVQADNLSIGLFHLSQLLQEIPESRFGNCVVGREDSHAVQLGVFVCFGGQVPANDLVFVETPCNCRLSVIWMLD